jgi:hypothetical protein
MLTVASGCASPPPQSPSPEYVGPKATIVDTSAVESGSQVHLFYVVKIEEQTPRNSGEATYSANRGRGLSIYAVTLLHEIPARRTRLASRVETAYAAPILTMLNRTCRTDGVVDAVLEADNAYYVKGTIGPSECSVWLESSHGEVLAGTVVKGLGLT